MEKPSPEKWVMKLPPTTFSQQDEGAHQNGPGEFLQRTVPVNFCKGQSKGELYPRAERAPGSLRVSWSSITRALGHNPCGNRVPVVGKSSDSELEMVPS